MLKIRLFFLLLISYATAFGQSGTFGFNSILEGGELAIYGEHDFQGKGIMVLGDIVGAERSGARAYFSFVPNSTYVNCSDKAHVDGYVRTYQSGSFLFPIGNRGKWRPVGVSAASLTEPIDAAYFAVNPANGTLSTGTSFSPLSREARVQKVSDQEFWDINGKKASQITLSWNEDSGVENISFGQLTSLRILGWDGAKWVEIPSSIDINSVFNSIPDLNQGSITSTNALIPDTYEVYTLGSVIKDSDGDGVDDGQETEDKTDLLDPCSYLPIHQDFAKTSAAWRVLDCDGDGLTNGEEVDPDGDGTPGPDGLDPLVPNSTISLNCEQFPYAITGGTYADINVLVAYSNGVAQTYPEGQPINLNNGTLTATLQAGEINPAGGYLVYRVQGIPGKTSPAILPVFFDRKRCEVKIFILEANISVFNFSVLAFNDKNNNCTKDSDENENGLPKSGLFIKIFDLDNNLLYKREIENGQFDVLDFHGVSDVIYYYIIDTNDSDTDTTPNLPEGWKTGMATPALKRYFHFDGGLYKNNVAPVANLYDSSWDVSYPFRVCLKQSIGSISTLDCSNAQFSGIIYKGLSTSETFTINYSGANGGFYPAQSITSTGISGLTAKLESGSFSDGTGSLTFSLSGAPKSGGKGTFNLTIGGVSCQVEFTVIIPKVFNQDLNVAHINVPISGNVSINDVFPGGANYKLGAADSRNPSGSDLKIKSDGTYTFVATVPGVYRYQISICDAIQTNDCVETLLQITVLDPNSKTNLPVVNPDIATAVVNTPVTITVLANDRSANIGTELVSKSLSISDQPKNGTISINTDGTVVYTPNAGFIGSDSFTYRVCDNGKPENCQSAIVSIKVLADRIVPTSVSVDDYMVVRPNSKAERFLSGNVLDNDHSTDPNAKLTASMITGPLSTQGTLVFNADGSFTFTATAGFSGTVNVVYMLCDGASPANCSFATLHILVEPGDLDGDGVGDLQEALDKTDPKDACSFKPASQTFTPSAAWANADCDGDGVTNGKEKLDGTGPLDPCEFKLTSRTLTPSEAWRNGDCDGDGLTNDVDGTDDCDQDGIPNFLDPDTCKIDILMPNVFTPNGDGINDVIKPILLGIEKFVCFKVYNRWGNIIFESKERDKGWDGDFKTQGQATESFQWIVEGYDRDGKLVKRTGMITLLR